MADTAFQQKEGVLVQWMVKQIQIFRPEREPVGLDGWMEG